MDAPDDTTCPTCGKTLATVAGTRQHHTKAHGDPLPNRECAGCGVDFYDPKARRTYCDDCNPNAGEHNGNYRAATETADCRVCSDTFEYYPSDKEGIYCPSCVAAAEGLLPENPMDDVDADRLVRSCDECGGEMNVLRSNWRRGRGRFCSSECLHEWMRTEGSAVYNGRWRDVRPVPFGGISIAARIAVSPGARWNRSLTYTISNLSARSTTLRMHTP